MLTLLVVNAYNGDDDDDDDDGDDDGGDDGILLLPLVSYKDFYGHLRLLE